VLSDRPQTLRLIRRAEAIGCKALVITVDAPVLGRRERDVRNGFMLRKGLSLANIDRVSGEPRAGSPGKALGRSASLRMMFRFHPAARASCSRYSAPPIQLKSLQ
jgi:4-hydroxymandelate oxidase